MNGDGSSLSDEEFFKLRAGPIQFYQSVSISVSKILLDQYSMIMKWRQILTGNI